MDYNADFKRESILNYQCRNSVVHLGYGYLPHQYVVAGTIRQEKTS